MRKKLLQFSIYLGGGVATIALIMIANYFIMAWTEPTAAPPSGGSPIKRYALDAHDGSPSNALYVDNNGKVGLGLTSGIQNKLHVRASGGLGGITIDNSGSTANLILGGSGGSSNSHAVIWLTGYGQTGNPSSPTNGSWFLTAKNNWSFVIGHYDSSHIYRENIEFPAGSNNYVKIPYLSINGPVYSNGTFLTNTAPSSKKYKRDIVPINLDYKKILKLQPKSFVWKDNGRKDFGYIAEEVKEILPELYQDDGKTIGYDQSKLIFYVIELLKYQQKQIDLLKKENSKLKEAICLAVPDTIICQ